MAKTIQYDREAVVDKAMKLYWEKGFHATSMRNLQDVIDMRPGSIYAGFGSKEGLFSEALDHYAQITYEELRDAVQAAESPLQALKDFIKNAVINSHESAPCGMCMLVKTVAELTTDNSELLAQAQTLLIQVEQEFAKVITAAQQKGELPLATEPNKVARYLQIQLMGLKTYYRSRSGDAPVDELVADIFSSGPFVH